jgi:hypothetical protein
VLPALTFASRRVLPRRRLAGLAGIAVLVISALSVFQNSANTTVPAPQFLPDRLAPSTWALTLPLAWFEAPLAPVRVGDRVDLLAVRSGERSFAIPVAADLLVMDVLVDSVVFEVDEDAATAVATARASSLLIVPLLRSRR